MNANSGHTPVQRVIRGTARYVLMNWRHKGARKSIISDVNAIRSKSWRLRIRPLSGCVWGGMILEEDLTDFLVSASVRVVLSGSMQRLFCLEMLTCKGSFYFRFIYSILYLCKETFLTEDSVFCIKEFLLTRRKPISF